MDLAKFMIWVHKRMKSPKKHCFSISIYLLQSSFGCKVINIITSFK